MSCFNGSTCWMVEQCQSTPHLPSYLADAGIGRSVSDYFCNFPKQKIRHLTPSLAVIVQVSGGEKARQGFELLFAIFFPTLVHTTGSVMFHAANI